MKIADLNLVEALAEILDLMKKGASEEDALTQFDYLHPIQRARLRELVKLQKVEAT